MKLLSALAAAALASCFAACKSKPRTLTAETADRFGENVVLGAYYRTGLTPTAFYLDQPDSVIHKTPAGILGSRHVLQLLSASGGGEWARVRTEEDRVGFVRFAAIKIVPAEDRPKPPKRKVNKWGEDKY